jgi:hypothetical protein
MSAGRSRRSHRYRGRSILKESRERILRKKAAVLLQAHPVAAAPRHGGHRSKPHVIRLAAIAVVLPTVPLPMKRVTDTDFRNSIRTVSVRARF